MFIQYNCRRLIVAAVGKVTVIPPPLPSSSLSLHKLIVNKIITRNLHSRLIGVFLKSDRSLLINYNLFKQHNLSSYQTSNYNFLEISK